VAAAIADFVSFEAGDSIKGFRWLGMIAAIGGRAPVTARGVEVVVDMAAEVLRAVKPRAGAYEDAAGEPFGAVVAVGSAGVGSVIVIAIGAIRGNADVNADLSRWFSRYCRQGNSCKSKEGKIVDPEKVILRHMEVE
jgi:hypothetical protein